MSLKRAFDFSYPILTILGYIVTTQLASLLIDYIRKIITASCTLKSVPLQINVIMPFKRHLLEHGYD
jgi:hypothetical protein